MLIASNKGKNFIVKVHKQINEQINKQMNRQTCQVKKYV